MCAASMVGWTTISVSKRLPRLLSADGKPLRCLPRREIRGPIPKTTSSSKGSVPGFFELLGFFRVGIEKRNCRQRRGRKRYEKGAAETAAPFSFNLIWRARRDLNPRPLASESDYSDFHYFTGLYLVFDFKRENDLGSVDVTRAT